MAMTPINNSDTAWLIVSDYNQENGKFYEELREDILNVNMNDWYHEYLTVAPNVGGAGGFHVGHFISGDVGHRCNLFLSTYDYGTCVGGNYNDPNQQ